MGYNPGMGIEAKHSLPFDTSKFPIRISQGNNGPWSHYLIQREIPSRSGTFSVIDLTYAVDFALPFGTEIRATKNGQIYAMILTSDWFYEGLDPEIGNNPPPLSTNLIILRHEDGTTSLYSHITREALVCRGQFVKRGEVIARTGKSGWVAEVPHLHLQVNTQTTTTKSLPFSFTDYPGSLDHETMAKKGLIWFGNR